jgi:predicted phosphoribosyltransferase
VCLSEEPAFFAVGQFYRDFQPVEDDDVVALLDAAGRRPTAAASPA